jgi:hypothetical protein
MSQIVYVPLIVHGRDKYEYHAISCGCFLTKESACNNLLKKLIESNFISYDLFMDILSDRLCEIVEAEREGEEIEPDDRFDNVSENITEEEFTQHLTQKVNGNVDILDDICQSFGDSYYKDGWKFQIDEHYLTE